jgi:lysophospholipase L1-like esterase
MTRTLHSRVLRATAAVVVVALTLVSVNATRHWNSSANAASTTTPTNGFYLDIGASTSLGFQPTGIPAHNGKRTSTGYANDLVAYESKHGIDLVMRQVGCPGETTQTMLLTVDHCYKPPGRQLFAAEKYLEKAGSAYTLVTIDLGFNDVRPCLLGAQVIETCAAAGIAQVRRNMPRILADLKEKSGPNVHFIGLDYGDPFLQHYLLGASEIGDANATLTVMTKLDNTLRAAYSAAGIPTANVAGAYRLFNTVPTTIAKFGSVPENVAVECAYTWMCTPPPFGPDDHPNNAGYAVIATKIEEKLPTTR